MLFNILKTLRKELQLTSYHQKVIQGLAKTNNTNSQIYTEHIQNLTEDL